MAGAWKWEPMSYHAGWRGQLGRVLFQVWSPEATSDAKWWVSAIDALADDEPGNPAPSSMAMKPTVAEAFAALTWPARSVIDEARRTFEAMRAEAVVR